MQIKAKIAEYFDDFDVVSLTCCVQRRDRVVIADVVIGAELEKNFDRFGLVHN